jgi:exopolysaccharide biosynthesis WecB/TagA/CpsF family protein
MLVYSNRLNVMLRTAQTMSLGSQIAAEQNPPMDAPQKILFGLAIEDLPRAAAIGMLLRAIRLRQHMKIAFCNAHTANLAWRNAALRELLGRFTVFPDGIGVDIGARLLHGQAFAANLNGTDFVPALLAAESRPLRIALFGARPGVAEKAAAVIAKATPHHTVVACSDGFASEAGTRTFLADLEHDPVDMILVAMGNPVQEQWIAANIMAKHATLAMGVGALFDFLAGEVPRAPVWMRQARLEWLYRLAQEPERLFKRYVLGNPLFLLRVAAVKLGLRRFDAPCRNRNAS